MLGEKMMVYTVLFFVISVNCDNIINSIDISSSSIGTNQADLDGSKCKRKCVAGEPARVCYFDWHLEHYHAMGPACKNCSGGFTADCFRSGCITADGIERGVMSINKKIPGPPIQVCRDDLIVVDVTNAMGGTAATIHWHGLHQRSTPYMDGVPFITQCPIIFANTFRYFFQATEVGTQFYHSHTGHHKVNGHYGALIIREPIENDINAQYYDYDMFEHTIVASDWMHDVAEMYDPGLPTRGKIQPKNVLINGRGQYTNKDTRKTTKTPLEVFEVRNGFRYRFRFINSASHVCPLQLQIENHTLMVIAADSFHLKPKNFDTLITTGGERYDFIFNAVQPGDLSEYFMRLRAIGPCDGLDIEQFAILSYVNEQERVSGRNLGHPMRSMPNFAETFYLGTELNHPNASCFDESDNRLCFSELQSYKRDYELENNVPDKEFTLAFDNYMVDNKVLFREKSYRHFMDTAGNSTFAGAINKITFTSPTFSLLTQSDEINENMFCDENNLPVACKEHPGELCPCIHRFKVQKGDIVQFTIVDETKEIRNLNHPFHIHGYPLHVMQMGQHPGGIPMTRKLVNSMFKQRMLPVNPYDHIPPLKDTVSVPSRGYVVIRFRADNPGFWFLHCHFEWHMAIGMASVLQVGEPSEMQKPPENFPKCGNYKPTLEIFKRN